MNNAAYSVHEIVDTLDLAINGLDTDEIAAEVRITPKQAGEILRYYTGGLAVAKERRSHGSKPRAQRRRGVLGRPSSLTDDQRARIPQLHGEGLFWPEITRAVRCTEGQARYIAERGR